MALTENREVMASNIRYYMDKNHVNATELCAKLGFKQNTFSDWINGKTYPRIDKIEIMARYFGIPKSFLVEDMRKNVDFVITDAEKDLITSYRMSDEVTRESVNRLLTYYKKIKELTQK